MMRMMRRALAEANARDGCKLRDGTPDTPSMVATTCTWRAVVAFICRAWRLVMVQRPVQSAGIPASTHSAPAGT